jgi:excisionase family DNA binding protein
MLHTTVGLPHEAELTVPRLANSSISQARAAEQMEWLDLRALVKYASVSERTLREWIHRPLNPLPAVRVDKKILVRRSHFDRWLEAHQVDRGGSLDIGRTVDGLVRELTGKGPNGSQAA